MIIRLCDISSNSGAPLTDPSNAVFATVIDAWFSLTQRIYIWNYVVDFGNYVQSFPNYVRPAFAYYCPCISPTQLS